MVQSGKSFLETQKRLKAAAKRTNIPGTTDVEEQTTSSLDSVEPEENKSRQQRFAESITESKLGKKLIGVAETLGDKEGLKKRIGEQVNKIGGEVVESKIGQSMINFANRIPESELGQLVEQASSTPGAKDIATQSKQAIEGIKETQEERDIILGEDVELKKKGGLEGFLRGAATIARETPIIKRGYFAKKFAQSWEDYEKSTYLSDGKIVIKEPTLQQFNNLENTKNMAASIAYAYMTQGKIVEAQRIREVFEGLDDVSDDTLNRFIGGIIYNTINKIDTDREYVAEKYGDIVKSDDYLSEKQATIDLLLDENTRDYGITDSLWENIEADSETKKVIQAYQYIGAYANRLESNGYNSLGSTARGLAQTYKDADFQFEDGMSLKDAYETAAKYDQNKLENLIKQISYNLQQNEKYSERKYKSAEEYPGRRDAKKFVQDMGNSINAILSDFAEYNVEGWSESGLAKYSPLGLADLWISGNTFTDESGNIRNRDGKVIYERHDDGTYTNNKGENVTALLREHKGLLKNIGAHVQGITEGLGQSMEGMVMAETTTQEEGFSAGLGYELEVLAGLTSSAFNTMLMLDPKFLALESTPVAGEGINKVFETLSGFGSSITMGALQMLNLADAMDPDNVKAAQELGGTLTTIRALKKYKDNPQVKSFKEAFKKTWDAYKNRMVDIMGREEMNEKIKNPKDVKALEDKTKEKKEEIIDGEKTIEEIKEERRGEIKEETKQEVVKETPKDREMKVNEPTEREIIDQTSTKDKLGYVFQVNRAVMSEMLQEFKKNYQEALEKNTPKGLGSAVKDFAEETTDAELRKLAEEIQGGTPTFSLKDFVKDVSDGIKNIWNAAKNLPKRIGEKITAKKAVDAYDRMGMSDVEKTTLRNNSKVGKLGEILNRLIRTKRGKTEKIENINRGSQVEKYVKREGAKDWLNDAKQLYERLQTRKKQIHDSMYQKLTSIKNIKFGNFFTGEKGIKKVLNELIRNDPDLYSYINFREVDGKIVMDYKKGYSTKFDNNIIPQLRKIIKEYNDMVERGNISEMNISKLNDMFKDLRKMGTDMERSANIMDRELGRDMRNMGDKLSQALKSYLEETGQAKKLLLGEKAYAEVSRIENMFKKLFEKGTPSEDKVIQFLEGLSKEEIGALDQLINTSETIDLMKNGSTALSKIYDFMLSSKEIKSKLGELLTKSGKLKDNAVSRFGTILGVMFMGTGGAKIIAAIGGLLLVSGGLNKLEGRLVDKAYQRNLKRAVEKAIKNPQNKQHLQDIAEGLNDGLTEIDRRINKVISTREQKLSDKSPETQTRTEPRQETKETEQGPNRREYDTSVPNREEYDPNAPIFRKGEDKQQPSEQRDNDMVVSDQEILPEGQTPKLTDERQYLEYNQTPEEAEAELQKAVEDFEVQMRRALKDLRDMIDDSDDNGDGGNGGTPKKPTAPDTQNVVNTIDDFLAQIGANEAPKGEDRPNFSNWSNESLGKLYNTDGTLKEGVPTVYEEELSNEIKTREAKKTTTDTTDQNTIISRINKEIDKVKDGKRKDIEADEFSEDIQQARGVDQFQAADIFDDIVEGRITETDTKQKKTIYEDNEEANKWISKRTGKETKATKSASKTSSLEVRDTKPDSQGKLNALKTQLATKKKAKPTKKRKEEIDKLEKEIARLEEKLNNRELDEMDIETQKAIDESIAEEEKPQVQPSEEKISEPQEEEMDEISTLMTFNPQNATAEEIKKAQIALTKKKNDGDLGIYKKNEVDRKINELNDARIEKEDNLSFSIAPRETKNGNTDIKSILDEAKRLAKENKTNTESEYNKLMIREAMIDPVDFVQKNNKTPNMITYSRIANMFNRFNEQTTETQEKFMNIFREKAKENNLYSKDRYADKNGLLITLEDTINEMGEVEGREESYETFTGKPMKKNYSERDYNGEKKYVRTDFGISYGQDRINDPVTAKTMRKVAMDVRDISYILDLDMAKIIKEESKLLSERPSEREPMKSNRVGELKVNPTRGQTKSDALGYYNENKNTVATNTMKHTTAHEYFHQITEMERRIRESGRRTSQGVGNQKFYDKVEKNDKIMNGMINGDKISKEYYNSPTEYTSRMMEMYLADKQGGKEMVESMFGDVDGYRPREIYEKEIKPLVEKDLLEPLRKKYGRNPDRTERETYDELIESGYYD